MKYFIPLTLFVLAFSLAACDSTDPDDGGQLDVQTASDIPADPATHDPETGQPQQTGRYTLLDIETGDVVLSYDNEDRSDSLSTTWDIGFQSTNLIANTTSGSEGGILFVENTFEEVTEAPAGGYGAALPGGSGNGWYNYDEATNVVTPIPGRVILIKTAAGNYAKIRILSYYEGAPSEPTATDPEHPSRHYTFEYVVQPNGTRDFPME